VKDLAAALLLAYGAAVLYFPGRTLKALPRLGLFLLSSGIILLSPLAIPVGHPLLRFFSGLQAAALFPKLYDLHRHPERAGQMTPADYLAYLPNWFTLVWGINSGPSRSQRGREVRRFLAGGAGFAASVLLVGAVFSRPWYAAPFLAEHGVKTGAAYLAVLFIGGTGTAFWRILGRPALDLFDSPHRAATPADFWRRWNRPVRQFFFEDVFKPLKGIRRPVPAILLTFGVSACIHEYLFSVAVGRVQGYQTAFFMLQAVAVVLTRRLKPRGRGAAWGNGLTLLFLLLSSVLFALSLNGVLPFYDPRRPLLAWMHR
jgi:hypothetical protein